MGSGVTSAEVLGRTLTVGKVVFYHQRGWHSYISTSRGDDSCITEIGSALTIKGISADKTSVLVEYSPFEGGGGTSCSDGARLMFPLASLATQTSETRDTIPALQRWTRMYTEASSIINGESPRQALANGVNWRKDDPYTVTSRLEVEPLDLTKSPNPNTYSCYIYPGGQLQIKGFSKDLSRALVTYLFPGDGPFPCKEQHPFFVPVSTFVR
jgi:hypothetical protein